mgnify:CR=1 FL=1
MRKILAIAVLLFFISAATPFKVAIGGNESQLAPKMTVIFDEPQPSRVFINFFYFFNQAMIRWWQEEGRLTAKGEWKISVSEYSVENSKPIGVMMVAARSAPGLLITFGFWPVTAKTAKITAATAADAAILVIKAVAKEDKK